MKMRKYAIIALTIVIGTTVFLQTVSADETTKDLNITVGVDSALKIDLLNKEGDPITAIDFGSHDPGETSWADGDDWNMGDTSTATVRCTANNGDPWTLYTTAQELTSGINKIDYVNGSGYANFGWTATAPLGATGDLNEHSSSGNMLPYGIGQTEDNRVYTSGPSELGQEVYVWTGIQIPLSQAVGSYATTVTYTLTQ
jgi:hypothetical protein